MVGTRVAPGSDRAPLAVECNVSVALIGSTDEVATEEVADLIQSRILRSGSVRVDRRDDKCLIIASIVVANGKVGSLDRSWRNE